MCVCVWMLMRVQMIAEAGRGHWSSRAAATGAVSTFPGGITSTATPTQCLNGFLEFKLWPSTAQVPQPLSFSFFSCKHSHFHF